MQKARTKEIVLDHETKYPVAIKHMVIKGTGSGAVCPGFNCSIYLLAMQL